MQDPTKPKVLYELAGIPLIGHVLNLGKQIRTDRTIVIIGFGRDQVRGYVLSQDPTAEFAIQAEQLGTGHAMQQTASLLEDFDGDILVLYGDVPLLSDSTVRSLLEVHKRTRSKGTVLSAHFDNPKGYGRIVRTPDGAHLSSIVEERDATDEIRKIQEINSGIYVFDAKVLYSALAQLEPNNDQKEYYLTDVFSHIIAEFGADSISISQTSNPIEVSGINTKDQLEELEQVYIRKMK